MPCQATQDRRRAQGVCVPCGAPSGGRWRCDACQAKKSERARQRRAKETPEEREERLTRKRGGRPRLKKGRPKLPPEERKKRAELSRQRSNAKRRKATNKRRENGDCTNLSCSNKAEPGYTTCKECRVKKSNQTKLLEANWTPEQREKRRIQQNESAKLKRRSETPEQREKRLQAQRDYRAKLSPEQRQRYADYESAKWRNYLANLTPEENEARLVEDRKRRERYKVKFEGPEVLWQRKAEKEVKSLYQKYGWRFYVPNKRRSSPGAPDLVTWRVVDGVRTDIIWEFKLEYRGRLHGAQIGAYPEVPPISIGDGFERYVIYFPRDWDFFVKRLKQGL